MAAGAASASAPPPRIDLLGSPLDLVDSIRVKRWIAASLVEPDAECRHIVTLNPEYVIAARHDRPFHRALWRADLAVADGVGVVIAARLLGHGTGLQTRRVTGVQLVDWLASSAASANQSLFLLGGRDGAGERTASLLRDRHGAGSIAGWWEGGTPNPSDDAVSLERIERSGATMLAVAYGAPAQVLWIDRNRQALTNIGVRVAIGVGGAFDYWSGLVPRAPAWMSRWGLEWLYRLVREPHRWRRQMALPRFALLLSANLLVESGRAIARRISRTKR